MKIKLANLLILLFFLSQISIGQDNLFPGYLINNNSDTISGHFINDQNFPNETEIQFVSDESGAQPVIYTVDDIKGYYFTKSDEHHVSKKVNIFINDDSEIKEAENISKKVFLKALVEGETKLYSFYDIDSKIHYYLEKNGRIQELYTRRRLKTYYEDGQKKESYVEQPVYLGILKLAFNDCKNTKRILDKVVLEKESLTNVVTVYNNCFLNVNGSYGLVLKPASKFKISGFISYNLSKWDFSSDIEIFSSYDSKFNKYLSGGVEVAFLFPEFKSNFSVHTGVSFLKNKYENTIVKESVSMTNTQTVEVSVDYLYIPVYMNYSIMRQKLDILLSVGIFTAFVYDVVNSESLIYDFDNGDREIILGEAIKGGNDASIYKLDLGVLIGIGLSIPVSYNIDLISGVKYNIGNGISRKKTVSSQSQYIMFYTGISI